MPLSAPQFLQVSRASSGAISGAIALISGAVEGAIAGAIEGVGCRHHCQCHWRHRFQAPSPGCRHRWRRHWRRWLQAPLPVPMKAPFSGTISWLQAPLEALFAGAIAVCSAVWGAVQAPLFRLSKSAISGTNSKILIDLFYDLNLNICEIIIIIYEECKY